MRENVVKDKSFAFAIRVVNLYRYQNKQIQQGRKIILHFPLSILH